MISMKLSRYYELRAKSLVFPPKESRGTLKKSYILTTVQTLYHKITLLDICDKNLFILFFFHILLL